MEIRDIHIEDSGTLVRIAYNLGKDEDHVILLYKETVKNFFVEKYFHNGITKSNVEDAINKEDPKYSIEDKHVTALLNSIGIN